MSTNERIHQLHNIAQNYVIKGLGEKNFDSIPYHQDVILRAPINPGGSEVAMQGKETVKSQWWAPLPDLLDGVILFDSYINQDLSAVTVEFHCKIKQPACTLRIIDRFEVDEDGLITRQENFFDPRGITNP